MVEGRAQARDLGADHPEAVVVKLLAQEKTSALTLEEAGRNDLAVVGGGTDRLELAGLGAADLDGDVGPPALR